ncbi:MAG TPA: M15 family metallopeptidase [Gemmatimonadales bacterium]|nr:M15 family metallopeptidase [Gemmatimonadales bacterium]
MGRTLPGGVRVIQRVRDTPRGPLYRAEYPSGLEVAVLLLGSTSADTGGALSLLRQRYTDATRIHHPNVAAMHELSETEDGLIYLVAESLKGQLLSKTLAKRGALPLRQAIDLCLQAASGLQAAHEAGWVHGRLSPDSILLTPGDGEDRTLVKLIGFTPELLLDRGGTEPPVDPGLRMEYASPERITGQGPDERADVYSLAAVLHHLVTGLPPGKGGAAPTAIRAVLARALDPAPERRFQTVAEFAVALAPSAEPVVESPAEPTKAARGKLLHNLWPEERAVAAALIAVAAGLGWLLWVTQRPAPTGPRETGSVAPVEIDSLTSSSSPAARARVPADSAARSGSRPAASGDAMSNPLLVDVRSLDSTIRIDLRYATANNFTGAPLPGYQAPRALLRREAAAALVRVQARLRREGLGLKVFDAYRPVRASRAMVEWAERTGRTALIESGYITPRTRHNLAASVDLTLVDLGTGTEVPMGGTAFDSFTDDTTPVTGEALRNRQTLVRVMKSEGFSPYGQAWWHFNYPAEGAVPLDQVIR